MLPQLGTAAEVGEGREGGVGGEGRGEEGLTSAVISGLLATFWSNTLTSFAVVVYEAQTMTKTNGYYL